jgi:hypothetical protein
MITNDLTIRGTKRKNFISFGKDPFKNDAKKIALRDMEKERQDLNIPGFNHAFICMSPALVKKRYFQPIQHYIPI